MKKQYIFVANWKMNKSLHESNQFIKKHFDDLVQFHEQTKQTIVICPSFPSLSLFSHKFQNTGIEIGAQNCSPHTFGPFTGQVAAQDLREIGCTYTIIGHSETRNELGETNELIAQKCLRLLSCNMTPIICVGESKKEHDSNKTLKTLEQQIQPLIAMIRTLSSDTKKHTICVAYEPFWAIGTKKTSDPQYIQQVLSWLSTTLTNLTACIEWRFLYGGSISIETIDAMKSIPLLDGFLIGRASLSFQELKKIVQSMLV